MLLCYRHTRQCKTASERPQSASCEILCLRSLYISAKAMLLFARPVVCPGQGEQGVASLCYSGTAGEGFTFWSCAQADHCRLRVTQLNPQPILILAPIPPSISRSPQLLSPLCFFRPVHFCLSHTFCMHRPSHTH
jgi:hypothetical protein